MSRLYTIIENQVNNLLQYLMIDEAGRIQYNSIIPTPDSIRPAIVILTMMFFIAIVSTLGIFLWNQGLSPLLPVEPITGSGKQLKNKYLQLFLTLVSINMLF